MGYLSSTTKVESKSQSAPLTEEGLEYQSIVNSMMMQNFDQAGYEPIEEEKTVFDDPGRAGVIKGRIAKAQANVDRLRADIETNPAKKGMEKNDRRTRDLKKAESDLEKQQTKLDESPSRTYTDYTFKKKEDVRVTAAKEQYGADSQQVKDLQGQIKSDEVELAEGNAQIAKDYLKGAQKLVSGDYSYTTEQKAVSDKYFAEIASTLSRTTEMLMADADAGQADLFSYIGKFQDEIEKTGYDTMDALNAALIQVEQSGSTLMNVAETVNQKSEAKAKFEFDLLSQQADQRAAQQSALLGLPPGSAVEKKQAAGMKYNALQSVLLSLDLEQANRSLGIASDTESGKKAISMAKVDLAQSQGSKNESLQGVGLNIAQATNQQKFGIKSAYAQGQLGIENDKMNLLFNSAVGQLPNQVAGGQSYMGFGANLKGAELQQNQMLAAPAQQNLNLEQQRTFNDATKTQTTTSTPSMFSAISSGISTAAGAVSGIMSGGLLGGK